MSKIVKELLSHARQHRDLVPDLPSRVADKLEEAATRISELESARDVQQDADAEWALRAEWLEHQADLMDARAMSIMDEAEVGKFRAREDAYRDLATRIMNRS